MFFNIPIFLISVIFIFIAGELHSAEYYVSPDGADTSDGTKSSPWSLARANTNLKPGDKVILLSGVYTKTPINPTNSGVDEKAICYISSKKHEAIFRDIESLPESCGTTAIFMDRKSHISIDGIKVLGGKRWIVSQESSHIRIENCHFENASGWQNCRLENSGDGFEIIGNYFNGGTDLVSLDGGDNHLVENNFFGDAEHTSLAVFGVRKTIIRNNTFRNRRWRCMEVESRRKDDFRRSEYNLIENNIFDFSPGDAIQYAGNHSILRKNIFLHCLSGMGWANYLGSEVGGKKRSPEAWNNKSNRFYNNVIAECGTNEKVLALIGEARAAGIDVAENVSDSGYGMTFATNLFNPSVKGAHEASYGDLVIVNNIFYMNRNDKYLEDKKGMKHEPTVQVAFDWNASPEFGRFWGNFFWGGKKSTKIFYFCDAVYAKPVFHRNSTILEFEEKYLDWADANEEKNPSFVAPNKGDFHLKKDSPCIDVGVPLTKTVAAGSGRKILVADSLFFTDGYGIANPDIIRVGNSVAMIVEVDYVLNILSVENDISWEKGDAVSLDYVGKGSDVGAFELKE